MARCFPVIGFSSIYVGLLLFYYTYLIFISIHLEGVSLQQNKWGHGHGRESPHTSSVSTVAAALYAGRSLVLSSWYRYCGTYNSPTDIKHRLNVHELTSGACSSRLPGEIKKPFPQPVRLHARV